MQGLGHQVHGTIMSAHVRKALRTAMASLAAFISCVVLLGGLIIHNPGLSAAESSSQEPTPMEEPTPLAGHDFRTKLFGEEIHVDSRDRRSVTAASFGIQWIPDGPSQLEVLPFGALYVWRNWDDNNRRLRGTFSGAVNDLDYSIGLRSFPNWTLIFSLDNFIVPLGRSEYVEGQRIRETEIEWSYVFGGVGIGYRLPVRPFRQDSAVNIFLTYEPGYRWFKGTGHTSPQYGVPSDTYEGRIHFRVRTDAMTRNLMELPHAGVTLGGDIFYGHRAKWVAWGGPPFDTPDFKQERTYLSMSGYVLAATGLPLLNSDKHRLVASLHGGIGKDLDRFSTFRLPGRPTGYEWDAVALPMIHGVAFNELMPRHYAIANVQYRYEALFFLYPYVEAGWAFVEQARFSSQGRIKQVTDSMPTLGVGVVSGAPWRSQIELNYTYNFGIFRDADGGTPTRGGHGMFLFWSKELGSTARG
ncbi:MAG: putative Outer membrane channel [Candidatus Nitrospira kreftii]|uniref:Putative Outer membrane channel n=1 Tax=Candidatus Nitrospira kreftii TaxID=2652173 RepID=A0A7S8FEK7_9BACT|nr:MAG: putative Outer membrane channel [Candidatus Nitrospira kreftii]